MLPGPLSTITGGVFKCQGLPAFSVVGREEKVFRPVGEMVKDLRWGRSWCVGGTLCGLLWQKIRLERCMPQA